MSYILNALRKSERERQAIEPDTVTSRIVVNQPPRHQNSTKLIAALIAINLAILVYFLGFAQKTPPAATQAVAPVVKPAEVARAETMQPPLSVARPLVPKNPPIAEIVEARNAAPLVPPPGKPAAVKQPPIEPVKPVPVLPQPVIQPAKPAAPAPVKLEAATKQLIEAVKPAAAPLQPAIQAVEPPSKDVAKKTAPVLIKNDLPFLDDLPSEFSRSLPDLPINVFSYSSTPAERFVMIDMVKYIPGQRIKDLLELKEIRPDSIVVNYNGRSFKIKRP